MSDSEMNISDMLTEQVQRLFAAHINRDSWVQAERGTLDGELWQAIEAMGITLALMDEDAGGAGLSWAQSEPVLRLCGSHAAPAPLGETALAAWALARAGLEVPEGVLTLSGEAFELDDQNRVHGQDAQLSWLPAAAHVVVTALRDGVTHLCLMRADAGVQQAVRTLDRLPCANFVLANASPLQMHPAPFLDALGLRPHLATLRSVQMAGAMGTVLDLCVEYANTRVQFGRPIAKFQAIQQMIAELAAHAASAQVAGLYAARQVDAGNASYGAAIAKSLVGRAATRSAAIAHQVFGAIGVTDEHSLHYYTRRLWQWRAEAGSEHWWSERIGRQVLANDGTALWKTLTLPFAD
ncbi:acyl-CoA dehydrogenase [Pseudomonas capeferrum]|uniref:acyl-CoA dehydrogenase family protein n=1 Tax=Pseudomonas capeferrum TaxID=1495066 RepID=UPI0015E319F7|nr:acyl-CoA dehydrogenase family protein [Pseudomonas capeferrum]MBA1204290.1 acyl-CoA dehydrogenase [Pseudomonas capeferrum]